MRILGIESSCDDTGIAVVENGKILESIVVSQEHKFGVIPECAAREHHFAIYNATKKLFRDIDLIAYTNGPGLIGSLFVGSCFAKGLSYASGIPCIAINHLEGHFYLPYWIYRFDFPFLALLVSGGHTLLIEVFDLGVYRVIARTLDDAVGEVFDKVARHIGLEYPGGAKVEQLALKATGRFQYNFPDSMIDRDDFSFSGLKTAALRQIDKNASEEQKMDFCSQFQAHVAYLLADKLGRFFKKNNIKNWVVSGGVAANSFIKRSIELKASAFSCQVFYPPIDLCTDNGVMIAAMAELLYPIVGPTPYSQRPFS